MQNLINFWCFFFWLCLIFLIFNLNNLIKLIFYSELIWVVFYCYIIILGCVNDDITLISSSFFILGFAGLEYSLGILLILLYKNVNNNTDININEINNKNNFINNNKNFINIKK